MSAPDRSNDDELRAYFAHLAEEDATRIPSVEALLEAAHAERPHSARPHRGSSWPRRLVPVGLAAMLALWFGVRSTPEQRFERAVIAWTTDPALGAWQSPTNFLLAFPGDQFLRTVPSIGDTAWLATGTQDDGRTREDSTRGGRT